MDDQQNELIAQFSGVTGASAETARGALQASDWQLQEAVALYYASQEGGDGADDAPVAAAPTAPQPNAAAGPSSSRGSSSASRRPTPGSSKLRTLRDIQAGSGLDDADDDDEDDDPRQDFFTGGEKSGLAVQNPNHSKPSDLIKNILERARQNAPRPGGEDEDETPRRSSNFTGRAQTLGGDDAPSRVVEDPSRDGDEAERLPLVQRTLHLWNDGFSVDDGDLYRFDDPSNAAAVALIQQGRAPQSILNVQHNQRVDLNLIPHKSDFVQPKKVYKAFGGEGQRLGSPGPGVTLAPTASSSQTRTASGPAATSPTVTIDESQPAVTVQFRLGDGTRVSSRFNVTHTVAQLYEFVGAASPSSSLRAWTLMTTFPSTELADKSVALADTEALKKGGVVVQKWTS